MLTLRGWWFVLLVLAVLGVGGAMYVRSSAPSLVLVGLGLLIWFASEWAMLFVFVRLTCRRVKVKRVVCDVRGPARLLWAKQTYRVEVTVELPRGSLPYVQLTDRPAVGVRLLGHVVRWTGRLVAGAPAKWSYEIAASRMGVARFEGVRLQLADLQGFFYFETFVRESMELAVLPAIGGSGPPRRADKKFNMLPPPGVHRLRRPGSGSELLELRDYQPGDPPKRIAWKVSARRDQLITREYESEVPVRCTLLIDATSAAQLEPAGVSPLLPICGVAATVTEVALRNRDLVGLVVNDIGKAEVLRPARTSQHLIRVLEMLAHVAPHSMTANCSIVEPLLPRSFALASEIYPELMRPALNRYPFWLPWLWPPANHRQPRSIWKLARWPARYGQVFSAKYRLRSAQRKRLAAAIVALYGLQPGALAMMLEDDASCSIWLQRFLADHRIPYDLPTMADGSHVEQAAALMHCVSRGRDNELFVVMGDYVGRSADIAPVLRSVRVARARKHQVIVVQSGRMPVHPGQMPKESDALLEYVRKSRGWRHWNQIRGEFARLGVPFLFASAGDPARLILHRMEQLRNAQGSPR